MQNDHPILRFRLDKTLKTDMAVSGRMCNIHCLWCHHDYMLHDEGLRKAISNRDFAAGVSRIIEVTQPKEVIVRISGDGEPTMVGEDELSDLIYLLKKIPQVKKVSLTTNGVLLGTMVSALQSAGLDGVTISINSLDQNLYYFYTGADFLNKVLQSIETCLATEISTKLNVIYSRLNVHEVNDFIRYAYNHPKVIIKFFELIPSDNFTKRLQVPIQDLASQIEPLSKQITSFVSAYHGKAYCLDNGGEIHLKTSDINNCTNLKCPYRENCLEGCRSSIRIRVDGLLQPCGIRHDNAVDLFSPNVSSQSIYEALKSGGKIL